MGNLREIVDVIAAGAPLRNMENTDVFPDLEHLGLINDFECVRTGGTVLAGHFP